MGLINVASKGLLVLIVIAFVNLATSEAKTMVVGGSKGWNFGVNYTDWATQNTPFYINDKLVFKYNPPNDSTAYAYSVYLLPSLSSLRACDFSKAQLLANATQGSGEGFEVELSQWRPYYFASNGDNGHHHCNDGLMKFFAVPWPRVG